MSTVPVNRILVGDVRQRLAELPDNAVDCVITSPPYWRQRDYGHADQLGVEASIDGWVEHLRQVCAELRRVLTPTGSIWLNVGDGYSRTPTDGAPRRSLLLGPQRLALRLHDDGWLIRNSLVWAKPNAMPQSVRSRLSNRHEVVYLLTRSEHYYFNLDAIRIPTRLTGSATATTGHYPPRAAVPTLGHGHTPRIDLNHGLAAMKATGRRSHPLGKNPSDCWEIPTASYRGAHFATFPLELVRRPLLASCPERVCTACTRPWHRTPRRHQDRWLTTGPLRPTCSCRARGRPGIVLDPFLGSGATALAALQHRRHWLGIEINPAYAALADQRLADWRQHQQHITRKDRPHGTSTTPPRRR